MSKHLYRNDCLFFKAAGPDISVSEVKTFIAEIKTQPRQYAYLIFDFSKVSEVPPAALRALTIAGNSGTQSNSKVVTLGDSSIKVSIEVAGLKNVIHYYPDLESVFLKETASSDMREFLIEAIGSAVKVALQTVASSEVVRKPIQSGIARQMEIGAIVGLTGKSFRGSLVLGMTTPLFLKIMSNMLQTDYTQVDEEIADGPAEILNVILGHLKAPMKEIGYGLNLAIPATISGSNIRITPPTAKDQTLVLDFTTEHGDFYVEMTAQFQTLSDAA